MICCLFLNLEDLRRAAKHGWNLFNPTGQRQIYGAIATSELNRILSGLAPAYVSLTAKKEVSELFKYIARFPYGQPPQDVMQKLSQLVSEVGSELGRMMGSASAMVDLLSGNPRSIEHIDGLLSTMLRNLKISKQQGQISLDPEWLHNFAVFLAFLKHKKPSRGEEVFRALKELSPEAGGHNKEEFETVWYKIQQEIVFLR